MFDLDDLKSRIEDLERKMEEQSARMEKKITDLNSKVLDRLESMENLLLAKLEGLGKEKPLSSSGKADGTSLVAPQSTGKVQETRGPPVSAGKRQGAFEPPGVEQPPVRSGVQIVPDGPHGFVTVEDETLTEPSVDEPPRRLPVRGSHGSGRGMPPEHNRRPQGYVDVTEEAWIDPHQTNYFPVGSNNRFAHERPPEFHRGPPMGPEFSHHYRQPIPTGEAYGMMPVTTEWGEDPNQQVSSARLMTSRTGWERPPVNRGEHSVAQGTGHHGRTLPQPPADRGFPPHVQGMERGFWPNNTEFQNFYAVSPSRPQLPELDFPRFDGTNPEVWLFKCELFFEFYAMDESIKVKVASFHMDGRAAKWVRHYWRGECPVSWDQFRRDLCTRFAKIKLESAVGKFFTLRHTSTVADYIERHQKLRPRVRADNPGLGETFFVECFIAGLKEDVRFTLLMSNPKTLQHSFKLALLREKQLECLSRHEQQDSDHE